MTATIVLFEDVDPFKDLHFPITFRAHIDYESVSKWDLVDVEAAGAGGGWIAIRFGHPLRPMMHGYVTSDAGYEAIEEQIASEIEDDPSHQQRRNIWREAAE